ncbi:hypothetical protein CARUB_v10026158mg [Capsella rubella]|uniref:Phorbol-ester/DAG-type domain-containing protein n=1 Tax=Capsella rubella TaxID=81985 RepID=R0EVH2_9BRAS|nr:hypothetical protein CARUB_v10026158mg [Capsella rubella]
METSSNLTCHGHPLTPSSGFALRCYWCKTGGYISNGYRCTECDRWFHKECVSSKFPNIFYHTSHPQHLLIHTDIAKYSKISCHVCRLPIYDDWAYHCFMCETFGLHLSCAIEAPRLTINHPQRHKHPLVFFPISGNPTNLCEVCKEKIVVESAYRCFECKVVLHVECENLPEVNHPCHPKHSLKICMSRTLDYIDNSCLLCGLKLENSVCKVCLQSINRFYGAYSCLVCINYVVHSQCATRNDIWDGIELEGVPEETEDIMSFKEVGDNMINHFSHRRHNLKLNKDLTTHGGTGSIRCEACMLPVHSDLVYSCEKCDFILHNVCAKLPRKKHHMSHNKPFTLHVRDVDLHKIKLCNVCGEMFNGFRYESDNVVVDVRCILTSELSSLEHHEHPLHYKKSNTGTCNACHESVSTSPVLSCGSCDYKMDFRCATLPKTVKHMCDQHLLSLSCNENNVNGTYWCDICEEKLDPNKWFYKCNECEVGVHAKCIIGEFSRLMPGRVFVFRGIKLIVLPNNHCSRPICKLCTLRCKVPFILKVIGLDFFFCSGLCLHCYTLIQYINNLNSTRGLLNN